MKRHFFLFLLLLPVFLILSLFRASEVSAAVAACASPANGSTVNPNNVIFTWVAVSGAPGYHFRLERNDPWAEVIIRNDIPGTSFTGSEGRNAGADLGSPINLTVGKSYHWRVWPSNDSEATAGSACDFTVATSPAAPTAVITANPSTVTSGQSTTLTWSSTNAVKCILNPPGVYKTVDPSGSDSFSPTTTTTYNIRCEGVGGAANSATASTIVTVTAVAPTASITGPSSGTAGQTLSYTAQVANGGSLSIFASRQDNAQFNCSAPGRAFTDSSGRNWCILSEIANATSGTATFTPPTAGTYSVLVNGYANTNFNFTSNRNTECTGNHFGLNATQQTQWSDCGEASSITITVSAAAPPARRDLCASTAVSPGTVYAGDQLTVTSIANEASLRNFRYAFYNRDNSTAEGPKIICQQGITSVVDAAQTAQQCPNGGAPLVVDKPAAAGAKSLATTFNSADLSKPDINWGSKIPTHFQVNGYFIDQYGVSSTANGNCSKPFDLLISATFNDQPLDLNGAVLSTKLAAPSNGATYVDVPVIVNPTSGSPRNLIVRFNYLSPPTNPAASCPAPGNTANFSWSGVSGAGGYTVYAFDKAQRIDWSAPCGSGGRDVCTRVTGTSASAGGLRPGVEYQWFVFACSGNTNNCSDPVSASFTCTASSATPTPVRRDLCVSTTVIPGEGHVTIPSTSNEANLKAFRYAFYNRDNGTKIICQQGITSVADDAETRRQCPNGGAPLVFDIQATADTTRSDAKTMSANFSFTELSKQDTNWNNQIPTHFQVNGYFIDQYGMSSLANTNCSKPFIATQESATPPRPIPGDADDNSCVSNVDLAQWTKEVKGDCHRCSAWTPGTTPPARKFAEDYSIWYDAFKVAKTLCGPAPAANCTTNVCQ